MREQLLRTRLSGPLAFLAALTTGILCLTGCDSPRERLPALSPRLMLDKSALAGHPLGEDQGYQLLTLQETPNCSVHILEVGVGREVPQRYFKKHDMFLCCIQGGAIVQIEEDRYHLKPGQSVLVPLYRYFRIIHHGSEEPFIASVVIAPEYDPEDVYHVQETPPRNMPVPTGVEMEMEKPAEKYLKKTDDEAASD